MLKYCNGCKRDLEIDNFYSYKKSICKQCVNKKVKCDYCDREFNSTNLSKHMKQIHSTLLIPDKSDTTLQRSDKSDSTLQRFDRSDCTLQRSDKSDSTLQRFDKSDSTLQRFDKSDSTLETYVTAASNFAKSVVKSSRSWWKKSWLNYKQTTDYFDWHKCTEKADLFQKKNLRTNHDSNVFARWFTQNKNGIFCIIC